MQAINADLKHTTEPKIEIQDADGNPITKDDDDSDENEGPGEPNIEIDELDRELLGGEDDNRERIDSHKQRIDDLLDQQEDGRLQLPQDDEEDD